MNIILINPRPRIWIKSTTLPLGIAYIASYIREKGYSVQIVDLNISPHETIPQADVYGITSTTSLIMQAYDLAAELKKRGGTVVLGGPHPTCLPHEALEHEAVDYVVRGEGEIAFYELLEAIKKSGGFEAIEGLSYKKDGTIIHNTERAFLKELDILPYPAYDLFGDLKRYSHPQPLIGWRKPVVNIMTSRGCPFNCHFCYKGTFGRNWRARSPQNILGEWEMLIKKYRVKELSVQDDCFNLKPERAIELSNLIVENKLTIPWTLPNGMRADYITEDLIVAMKHAGMYRTAVGVETGNQSVMDDIGKGETLEDIENAFKILKKHKIQTIAFFVMGNPKDTEETLEETIAFAKKLSPTFAQFSMATPFPGTRLYETVKALDSFRISSWEDYSQFDQKGYFDYPHLSGEQISHYVKKAYRAFYFRPSQIARIMSIKDSYLKIPDYIAGMVHFAFKGK